MNRVYQAIGVSKQSFHQRLNRQMHKMEELHQLLPIISQLRVDHPVMSAREMYRLINPQHIGRDRFIAFCFQHGYKVEKEKAFHKTTDSSGVIRFDNLISGGEFTAINQVWVSDITYYRIGEKFYYLTFIMDQVSRKIVGYQASKTLLTEATTLAALQMALGCRKIASGLIFHSDGGGQYYSKAFLELTKKHGIQNSMAESAYENPHAERINGIIKNMYLIHYAPQNFEQLTSMLHKAVDMYNNQKPHKSLKGLAPTTFEKLLTENQLINKRKKVPKKENMMTTINSFKTVNVI